MIFLAFGNIENVSRVCLQIVEDFGFCLFCVYLDSAWYSTPCNLFSIQGCLEPLHFCWFSMLIPILLGSTVIFEMEGLMMMFLSDIEGLSDLEG